MRVVVLGAHGQLGLSLCESAPAQADVRPLARAQCDVTDGRQVQARVGELRPDLVINCAAYNAVDRAEDDPAAATAVNTDGAGHVATACAAHGARLLHLSTDYVFDGRQGRPYLPVDPTTPINAYGRSKAAGEERVLRTPGLRAVIVRSAWLYSRHGRNFALTMLRVLREKSEVRVVDDQFGSPTWCGALAPALWNIARHAELNGILHWTCAGSASWYDFAEAISCEAQHLGLLESGARVMPVPSAGYPARAQRPGFSVLDKQDCWRLLGDHAPHWRHSLREMLSTIKSA